MPETPAKQEPREIIRANLEAIKEALKNGESYSSLAKKYGVNQGSIYFILNKRKSKIANEAEGQPVSGEVKAQQGESVKAAPALSELTDTDIKAAKTLLSKALKGKVDLSSQQVALIKFVLGDDDSDEEEVNPYAGVDEEELAERMLVCAVSVLGLASVTVRLRNMLKSEPALLDLLGDEDAIPEEAQAQALEQSEGKVAERLLYDNVDSDEDHSETAAPAQRQAIPVTPAKLPPAAVVVETLEGLED